MSKQRRSIDKVEIRLFGDKTIEVIQDVDIKKLRKLWLVYTDIKTIQVNRYKAREEINKILFK